LKLTKPVQSGTYTYTSKAQSLSFTSFNSSYETKSGDYSATDAGNYTCYISLNDTVNTNWADDTTSRLEYSWTINKRVLTIPTLKFTPEYTGG